MTEDELAEALTQYKQATQEESRLVIACQKARNEDPGLMQAEKDIAELDEERRNKIHENGVIKYYTDKYQKAYNKLLDLLLD